MVWSFQYEPSGSSYPNAEIAEGNQGALELVDPDRDGGTSLVGRSQAFSGRRVKSESVPKAIRFLSRRPLQDFENQQIKTVSDRLREFRGIPGTVYAFASRSAARLGRAPIPPYKARARRVTPGPSGGRIAGFSAIEPRRLRGKRRGSRDQKRLLTVRYHSRGCAGWASVCG